MITKDNKIFLADFKLKHLAAFISLFLALFAAYSNSFYGDWHFDDYANIVDNPCIRINSFSWQEIKHCIYGVEHTRPSRPLSFLSFALNSKLGGTDVFGYHVFNFIIHWLSAVFLFLFIYNTLKLPLLRDKYSSSAYPVAMLSTFFWALNPVWVTSVTYIVQRMASMAGLFYIMSMYFYLKARTSPGPSQVIALYVLCAFSGLASVLTKENAAMLPVSISLFELFLIQGVTAKNIKKFFRILIIPSLLIIIAALIYVDFTSIFDGYKLRDFTIIERLLTEPRVILFYLSLLFYPTGSRLTLLYDTEISRSLLQPWTTLPSIGLIFFIIVFSLYLARRLPLISFCVVFYFLNHFIEGSFFPLELIYEHRSYLPSMLLFIPVAGFLVSAINYFSGKKAVQITIIVLIAAVLFGEGYTTFSRNKTVSDDFLLWSDNITKSPNLSRPHTNLGRIYYIRNEKEKALNEYEKALALNNFGSREAKGIQEYNIGLYYFEKMQDDKALEYFYKSAEFIPQYIQNDVQIAKIKLRHNQSKEAKQLIGDKLKKYPNSPELKEVYNEILLKKTD